MPTLPLMDVHKAFKAAIATAGLTPPAEVIADGNIHRFATNGKADDDAGWYILHGDGIPAGAFGDWRTEVRETWCAGNEHTMSAQEREVYRKRMQEIRVQRDTEEQNRHAEAARQAARIWASATSATNEHPYLKRKGVRAHGLRLDASGQLIVPVFIDGTLSSLQRITKDGDKRFLSGGAKKGGSFTLGNPTSAEAILMAEGYATSATLHEVSGLPVVMSFDADNLPPVATALRAKYPDHHILVCGDNDLNGKGQRAAHNAAHACHGIVVLPGTADLDWNDVAREAGPEAVKAAIESAIVSASSSARDSEERGNRQHREGDPPWPVLDPAAYCGVIGKFVKAVGPYSEADPVGLLLHTLQGFGCLIGRSPHVLVEHLPHHARLNVMLVGNTANARKGTAWSTPKLMLSKIDAEWVKTRTRSGLSSGEGLIYNVRDAEGDDPGESDKRLLIIEQEFAGALKVMQREGNTLSARIRDAWDHGTLTPMTKRDRLTATDAHVCIMGHITVTELLRLLTETEQLNGFANRFLFALVRRSKFLPSGQGAPLKLLEEHLSPLSRIRARAQERGELKRDDEAEALWAKVYPKLEQEMPGLAGSILARGAAQVLRLSLLYALSDLEEAELAHPAIRTPHLMAALAVWDYCKASVLHVFGDAVGDPVADRLLRLLKTGPQTGNDLYDAMGRHAGDRDRKVKALELLCRLDLAHSIEIPTTGRPIEEWHYGPAHRCALCAKRVKSPPA